MTTGGNRSAPSLSPLAVGDFNATCKAHEKKNTTQTQTGQLGSSSSLFLLLLLLLLLSIFLFFFSPMKVSTMTCKQNTSHTNTMKIRQFYPSRVYPSWVGSFRCALSRLQMVGRLPTVGVSVVWWLLGLLMAAVRD